ncbi:MAG: helix-turn-helix domain-containing protein [Lentisphaerae bacterium]|nr:helix-turn-helix domain-containing protein [Lentisphaerota bacterium]
MNAGTRSAVSTLLAADPSVKPDSIPLALAVLDGKANAPSLNGQPVRLLTINEFAKRFGCTTRSVQRWIATGEIKFVRRGRLVRIPESELSG